MYELGQKLQLKKKHPCGSSTWEVVRVGADIKLRCEGCGHIVLLPYPTVKKMETKK